MYNKESKINFIESLPNNTKNIYRALFKRTNDYEEKISKDIYLFDEDECNELLIYLEPKSVMHIEVLISQFEKYVDWAVNKGIDTKNYWMILFPDEKYAIEQMKNRYVKDVNDLTFIVESGFSSIYDKYIPYLLYMGIMGEDFIEIRELLTTDIKMNQKMINTRRMIYNDIIEPLFHLIRSSNSYELENEKRRDEDSKYLIKPFYYKKTKGYPITSSSIYSSFHKLNINLNKELGFTEENKEYKSYTPMTIWKSGMFNMLYKIELSKGTLVYDDYKQVYEIFGIETESKYKEEREYELYKKVFWL